jgi:hypothetical protein
MLDRYFEVVDLERNTVETYAGYPGAGDYGEMYPRLARTKAEYDPQNPFHRNLDTLPALTTGFGSARHAARPRPM